MHQQNDSAPGLPSGVSEGWAGPDDALDDTQLWLRWDAGDICAVRILSAAPLFYPGHWFSPTRSYRLCTYPACQFCVVGPGGAIGTRKMASERRMRHLVAVETHSGAQRVFEFGEAVARQMQAITGYQRGEGGCIQRSRELRGLSLHLFREGSRQAGAVLVRVADAEPWPEYLPEPLDVAGHLAASWRRAALRDGKGQPRLPVGF